MSDRQFETDPTQGELIRMPDKRPALVRGEALSRGLKSVGEANELGTHLSAHYSVIPQDSELLGTEVNVGFFEDDEGASELVVRQQPRIDVADGVGYMSDGQRQTISGEEALVADFIKANPAKFLPVGKFIVRPVVEIEGLRVRSPAQVADAGKRFKLIWRNGEQIFRAIPDDFSVTDRAVEFVFPTPDDKDGVGIEVVAKAADPELLDSDPDSLIGAVGSFILDNRAEFSHVPRKELESQIAFDLARE